MTQSEPFPSASVVVPLYNKRAYVAGAIRSVLAQDTSDYEIIVVDDGSTDSPENVLDAFQGQIRYLRQENAGPGAARNRGIAESRGRFIAFLDADDAWRPEKLSTQLDFMEHNPGVAWTSVNLLELSADSGDVIGAQVDIPNELTAGDRWRVFDDWFDANADRQILRTSGVMVRREVFDDVGCFDPDVYSGQDLDLWIRIARRWPRFALCLTPLVEYRMDVPGCITNSGDRRLRSKYLYMKTRFEEVALSQMGASELRFFSTEFYNLAVWSLAAGNKELVQSVLNLVPRSWTGRWDRVRWLSKLPAPLVRSVFRMRNRLTKRQVM